MSPFRLDVVTFGAAVLCGAAACQGDARVRPAFDHASTSQAAPSGPGQTPAVFGVKIVAMYLAEDVDPQTMANIGNNARIWTNPTCDPDLEQCGIGPGAGSYRVEDYFDLALPTDEVNANLAAQPKTIEPTTYRYLRLDLAGPQGATDRDVPNLRFGPAGAPPHEIRIHDNGYTVKLEPPLVIEAGDSVTVTLGYSLAGAYFTEPGLDAGTPPAGAALKEWFCADTTRNPARGPCLRFSGFAPRASK